MVVNVDRERENVMKCDQSIHVSKLKLLLVFAIHVLIGNTLIGQNIWVEGKVVDKDGEPIVNAIVYQKYSNNATNTDVDGVYQLTIQPGEKTIVYSMVGFLKKEVAIDPENPIYNIPNVMLEADPAFAMDDVMIVGKSKITEIQESGFNAVAIDAKPYHNATVDMTQVLDNVPGVKIQQEGGLGSSTNVTINGLSGRHVRFFIDGMPMDAMSSAFQLNNLPVNLAERIEVYKGVVPVSFGSDALGGAVNIVTTKTPGSYLDVSYSFGSFNTHKTFVNAGFTSKKGFTLQLSAYQNYSDNSYWVDATIKDFETNLLSKEPQRVRRFHDVYHNETAILKLGFVNKSFADQLLFGFTIGHEYDEIQHPAYMNLAFGEKYHTSGTLMPSFLYKKNNLFVEGLNVSLTANFNLGESHNFDISDKEYNWLGDWQVPETHSPGEIQYSNYVYKNNNGTINTNLLYSIHNKHQLTLNNVTNLFSRQGDERLYIDDYINDKPRVNDRNILGIGINNNWNKDFKTSVFAKMYSYHASAYLDLTNNGKDDFNTVHRRDTKYGYGITATYFINDGLQLKGNHELTCRLPVSAELFGEVFGYYIANYDLKPETSNNYNVGLNYSYELKEYHVFNIDVNYFLRNTTDYIRRNIDYSQGEESYVNIDQVRTIGFDAQIRYSYKNRFNCGGNISVQEPKDLEKGVLPNIAKLFGNLDATYIFNNIVNAKNKLSLSYNMQFVDEFLYDYNDYKARNRASVKAQSNHNLSAIYSWKEGKYNISLDCKNVFDAKLFDNYSLQKPGRSFNVKLRYYLNKTR